MNNMSTPWKRQEDYFRLKSLIINSENMVVADCYYTACQGDNIVRAVNAFGPMREALRRAETALARSASLLDVETLGIVRAALALAEKED